MNKKELLKLILTTFIHIVVFSNLCNIIYSGIKQHIGGEAGLILFIITDIVIFINLWFSIFENINIKLYKKLKIAFYSLFTFVIFNHILLIFNNKTTTNLFVICSYLFLIFNKMKIDLSIRINCIFFYIDIFIIILLNIMCVYIYNTTLCCVGG